ncbi:MAG: tetratricopeptide repeat protein, partial [Thermodesulfobacteriota bacterium]
TDERTRYIDGLLQTVYPRTGSDDLLGDLKRVQTILLIERKTADSENLRHFRQILNSKPDDVDALYGLAVTQDRLGMIHDALDTFRSALRLAPDDGDILRDMGIASFRLGQYADASALLNRALGIHPNDADIFLYLGRTYEALGDTARALALYRKLEEKHPEDEESLYSLAMAYGKAKNLGDSHYYFGQYFKKKGKPDSALFHFRAALKHLPADSTRSRAVAREIETMKREEPPPKPALRQRSGGSQEAPPFSGRSPRGMSVSGGPPW